MAVAIAASFPYAGGPIQEEVIKKPHLSFKKWGFKISLPYLPPSKGIGERISMGMITEWEGMSTSIN
jgi:hypothetical protein